MMGPLAGGVTKPQWEHLEFCWKLENFWELRALGSIEALEDDNGDVIWSQQFGDKRRGTWRLKLYPYGDSSPGGKGHVSLFLSLDTKSISTQKAYAIFGCYILDGDGKKIQGAGRSFTRQKFAEGSSSWGWSQFIKVVDLNLQSVLVNNETLAIKCEVEVFTGVKTQTACTSPLPLDLTRELVEALTLPHLLDTTIAFIGCATNEPQLGEAPHSKLLLKSNSTLLAARCKVIDWLLKTFHQQNFSTTRSNETCLPGRQQEFSVPSQAVVYDTNEKQGTHPRGPLHGQESTNSSKEPAESLRTSSLLLRDVGVMTDEVEPLRDGSKSDGHHFEEKTKRIDLNSTRRESGQHGNNHRALDTESESEGNTRISQLEQNSVTTRLQQQVPPRYLDSFRFTLVAPNCYQLSILSPEVKRGAVESMLAYCLNDKCDLLTAQDADVVAVLQLLVAATYFSCDSVIAACTHCLIAKLTSKRNAVLVLDVGKTLDNFALVESCQSYFETCEEMSGTELLKVLEPPGHNFQTPNISNTSSTSAATTINGTNTTGTLTQPKGSSRGGSPPSTRSTASS